MKVDIILAGVGGQGILTIAFMLDNAAVARCYRFKQAEVHGMAQRGGAVYSHLRFSDGEVISDLIPEGRADMIISVEPLEVQRYLHFLKPEGIVVANSQPFKNIPDYPDDEVVLGALFDLPRTVLVDAKAIAESAGMPRAQNTAMLGAAIPFLPFEVSDFEPFIRELFHHKGDRVVEANMAVLGLGCRCGQFLKDLLEAGVAPAAAYKLLGDQELETLEPAKTEPRQ